MDIMFITLACFKFHRIARNPVIIPHRIHNDHMAHVLVQPLTPIAGCPSTFMAIEDFRDLLYDLTSFMQ